MNKYNLQLPKELENHELVAYIEPIMQKQDSSSQETHAGWKISNIGKRVALNAYCDKRGFDIPEDDYTLLPNESEPKMVKCIILFFKDGKQAKKIFGVGKIGLYGISGAMSAAFSDAVKGLNLPALIMPSNYHLMRNQNQDPAYQPATKTPEQKEEEAAKKWKQPQPKKTEPKTNGKQQAEYHEKLYKLIRELSGLMKQAEKDLASNFLEQYGVARLTELSKEQSEEVASSLLSEIRDMKEEVARELMPAEEEPQEDPVAEAVANDISPQPAPPAISEEEILANKFTLSSLISNYARSVGWKTEESKDYWQNRYKITSLDQLTPEQAQEMKADIETRLKTKTTK